jgi:hypothetical protein
VCLSEPANEQVCAASRLLWLTTAPDAGWAAYKSAVPGSLTGIGLPPGSGQPPAGGSAIDASGVRASYPASHLNAGVRTMQGVESRPVSSLAQPLPLLPGLGPTLAASTGSSGALPLPLQQLQAPDACAALLLVRACVLVPACARVCVLARLCSCVRLRVCAQQRLQLRSVCNAKASAIGWRMQQLAQVFMPQLAVGQEQVRVACCMDAFAPPRPLTHPHSAPLRNVYQPSRCSSPSPSTPRCTVPCYALERPAPHRPAAAGMPRPLSSGSVADARGARSLVGRLGPSDHRRQRGEQVRGC